MTQVVAIVPAHDEQERLPDAIRSLISQTMPIDRIVVVSDNSTDRTVEIARSWGPLVECIETVENGHMKAGALNQGLDALDLDDDSWVLIMDADSVIAPKFVEAAIERAGRSDRVGAIGGIFMGDGKNGLIGSLQELEYWRYAREMARDKGVARCLTGSATMFKMRVLREVRKAREDGILPGSGYYNTDVLTEDFCLTIAIKRLGYATVAPKDCQVWTETMGSIPALWRQRVRWQLGALQVMTVHGLNRTTALYMARQVETYVGLIAVILLWYLMIASAVSGTFVVQPIWLAIGAAFQVERVVSSWRGGWRSRFLASTFVCDTAFDLLIAGVYWYCLWCKVTRKQIGWNGGEIATEGAL